MALIILSLTITNRGKDGAHAGRLRESRINAWDAGF